MAQGLFNGNSMRIYIYIYIYYTISLSYIHTYIYIYIYIYDREIVYIYIFYIYERDIYERERVREWMCLLFVLGQRKLGDTEEKGKEEED